MKVKSSIVFAIVLKGSAENEIFYSELRGMFKKPKSSSNGGRLYDDSKEPITMADCFDEYSSLETLGGDDQWYCNVCKEHRDITKKLELYKAPKILCLHLKRFTQKTGGKHRKGYMGMAFAQIAGNEKNGALIDYPVEGLDMRPFVLELQNEPEPVNYDLYAVSNHYGSLNGGHYTAYCKNSVKD